MGILRADRVSGLGGANAINGSVFFGTSDLQNDNQNLLVSNTSELDIGSGNFTIEYWFNCADPTTDGFNASVATSEYTNSSSNTAFNIYHYSKGIRIFNRLGGGFPKIYDIANLWTPDSWHHFAWVREGTGSSQNKIYIDGTQMSSAFTNAADYTAGQDWLIGANFYGSGYGEPEYGYSGYLSNVRVSNVARYTGNFTVPTTRLEKDADTILLACQSPGDILKEETGKTLTPCTDNINTAFPVASRFAPDVGEDHGTTFADNTKFDTLSYMVPPGGTTAESNRGRAIFMGGYAPSQYRTEIDYIQIQSQGNAIDFGVLSGTGPGEGADCSSSTRAIQGGGSLVNTMEHVTIATTSNTTDFGDLTVPRRSLNSLSSNTRGIWAGGTTNPAMSDVIDYATIATTGDATDFGNLTVGRRNMGTAASPTRGVFAGGNPGSSPLCDDTIDYITIATTGDATDFGNLLAAYREMGGCSNGTRGIFAGGGPGSSVLNTIEFITIASTGNTSDFGDLFVAAGNCGGTSNGTRGIFAGGAYFNTIQYVTISTTGNAADFGDLTLSRILYSATSDSHGGIE